MRLHDSLSRPWSVTTPVPQLAMSKSTVLTKPGQATWICKNLMRAGKCPCVQHFIPRCKSGHVALDKCCMDHAQCLLNDRQPALHTMPLAFSDGGVFTMLLFEVQQGLAWGPWCPGSRPWTPDPVLPFPAVTNLSDHYMQPEHSCQGLFLHWEHLCHLHIAQLRCSSAFSLGPFLPRTRRLQPEHPCM